MAVSRHLGRSLSPPHGYESGVRLEVRLSWLLARFAQAAQRVIGQKGQLMLEKQ